MKTQASPNTHYAAKMRANHEITKIFRTVIALTSVLALGSGRACADDLLQIDKAVCGSGNSWRDVTAFLQGKVQGDTLSASISQPFDEIGGDPAWGQAKNLLIDYHFKGEGYRLSINEQYPVAFTIRLPSPEAVAPVTTSLPMATVAKQDFAPVGEAVVQLLRSGDTAGFAKALAPSIADWRAAFSTNPPAEGKYPLGPDLEKLLDEERQKLEASAKRLLAKAAELKLDFSGAQLEARVIPPQRLGESRQLPRHGENDKRLPWAQQLEIVLAVAPSPGTPGAERLRGEYTVRLRDLIRFPRGWRCATGLVWVGLPPGVADEKTQRELVILDRAAAQPALTQADDPALAQLGETLGRFIRTRDLKLFEDEALLSPREAQQEDQKGDRVELVAAARRVLELMERFAIDLSDGAVQVESAAFQSLWEPSGTGEIEEGAQGQQLTVKLTVQSPRKSKTGVGLSGDYALSAEGAVRKGGRWRLTGKVLGAQFPHGILDK